MLHIILSGQSTGKGEAMKGKLRKQKKKDGENEDIDGREESGWRDRKKHGGNMPGLCTTASEPMSTAGLS